MLMGHAKKIQNLLNAECCLADGAPRYEWEEKLGDGSFGIAYAFHDNQMKRLVTVKASKHPKSLGNTKKVFDRETEISSLVSHPNIVTIYDSLVCGNYAILIREYLQETLNAFINDVAEETENPTLDRVLQFLEPVCDAVQAAHQKGIVNRDIKGQNILVDRGSKKVIAKVSDWGSAGDVTSMSSAMSTLCFRAPETLAKQKSPKADARRADIYSVAAVTVGMFTGDPEPFDTLEQKSDKKYLDNLVAPLKAIVPENVRKTLRNCIDPAPGKRCSSIDEFIIMLKGQGAVEINTRKSAEYSAPAHSGGFTSERVPAPPKQPSLDSGFIERYQSLEQAVGSAEPESGPYNVYSADTVASVLEKRQELQDYAQQKGLSGEHQELLKKANAAVFAMYNHDLEILTEFCSIIKKINLTSKDREALKKKGWANEEAATNAFAKNLSAWKTSMEPLDKEGKIYIK